MMGPFKALFALQLLPALFSPVLAVPRPQATQSPMSSSSYWINTITRQGTVAYGNDTNYQVFRNVMNFGAKGDGVTDDTVAINSAISTGNRCGEGCDSSTTTPAIVYFPPGTYMVSAPIIQYYYTQFIGDAITIPTIKALPSFQGIAVIDSDPYIPNGGGANWYTNQNNFFRQVRNFVIDLTSLPMNTGAGIHWQVAQATSLQNIVFNMIVGGGAGNKQQGIFMDNGSGGFMTDLVFNGGNYGAFLGNQQFTTRNMTFNNCQTAIYMNWNWLWTLKSVSINNCNVGIDMTSGASNGGNQSVGSIVLMDSVMKNTTTGILTVFGINSIPTTGGTLVIDNVDFSGATTAIANANGTQILAGGAIVSSWAQGDAYRPVSGTKKMKRAPQVPTPTASDVCMSIPPASTSSGFSNMSSSPTMSGHPAMTLLPNSSSTCTSSATPVSSNRIQQLLTAPSKPAQLLADSSLNVFERSKPQYEGVPAASFISVKSQGAMGDGKTDDTAAIQAVLDKATSDNVVYFDHGAYVITSTINVPRNIKITGEIWPLIMASGPNFSDQTNPLPVFRVGMPGDMGAVEISELIFETLGPRPGAILMEWNVQEVTQGACGLWDVHFRVGGTAGTELQEDKCLGNSTSAGTQGMPPAEFDPNCAGSFLMLHITQTATAYIENVWLWVADHELDISTHNEVNIYNGRGMYIESKGPVWLYGTSVEHSQLYNYQIANGAQNIFMGAIQTETAYMQPAPDALGGGFTPNPGYSDPEFADCTTESCKKTWGLRIIDSSDVYMYAGGLYSFFDNYEQQCLDTESCQDNMVDIQCSSNIYLYGLTTKATVNMVTVNGQSDALGSDNVNGFGSTLALFEQ